MPTKYVYHYTEYEKAHDYILRNRTLKIGCYKSTNDPKESKDWDFDLFTRNFSRPLGRNEKSFSNKLSGALKSCTKVVCFSQDDEKLSGNHLNEIFLRGWAKPRMWAQYGGNHSGVCLVFDREALNQAIEKICSNAIVFRGSVSYANRSIISDFGLGPYVIDCDQLEKLGFENYVKEHLQQYHRQLFFEKMVDWEHESEFRWVIFSQSAEDIFVEIVSSIKGIIFGDRCPATSIDALIGMTEDLDVYCMGLKWKNSSPWYDYGLLRYNKEFRRLQKATTSTSSISVAP